MTRFAFGAAAILSAVATPVFAQQAVQEPGFGGVLSEPGCRVSLATTANAFASVGNVAPQRERAR